MIGLNFNASRAQDSAPYRIVAYYTSWAIYGREYFVTDIPADQLTHINYAFANISEAGEVVLGDEWADTQFPYPSDTTGGGNFNQLQLLKAAHPAMQTLISVGGWTWSGLFSDVALTPASRERFARSAVDFMLRYDFDGVDLDWEYPTGGGDPGNMERPEDSENFVLLLDEVRTQLDAQGAQDGRAYLLTIALGAGASAYEPLDWARIHPLLDWINVMTYDFAGGWSERTGFNAPLYAAADGASADRTLQALLALDIPADKLVLGVPFYGHGWSGVGSENDGLDQPFTSLPEGTWAAGSFDYDDLTENYITDTTRHWDERAGVPWLYDAATGTMITYDDAESMALKADYIRQHNLGGVMFWELSADDDTNTLLTALHTTLTSE
ncbi:MAG: glycoside hydrolase family 18 protein [Chloroflexota bacterium]|nr:glycoside hydrolase family 18 protein [Chloroflexota bacterium]